MTRKRFGVLVVGSVALAAVAGALSGRAYFRHAQPAPPPQAEQPALTVDPAHLDFGDVWESDKFEWSAPVRNRTETALQVSAYSSSCSCVSASSSRLIPAGESAPLTFRIDLRAVACASAAPQHVRDANIRVGIARDSAPTEAVTAVELRGRVKSALAVSARAVDFGRLALNGTKSRVVTVRGLVGLRELNATVDGTAVIAELKATGAAQWELHLRPTATAVVGRYEAKVKLEPITTNGERVPPVTLAVAYDVLADIQPDSPFVPLGAGRVGETLRGTFTVASSSGKAFPAPTCDGATLAPAHTTPQSSYTFQIAHEVAALGNQTVPVVVRGRDADGHPFEVRVDVQCYGVSP